MRLNAANDRERPRYVPGEHLPAAGLQRVPAERGARRRARTSRGSASMLVTRRRISPPPPAAHTATTSATTTRSAQSSEARRRTGNSPPRSPRTGCGMSSTSCRTTWGSAPARTRWWNDVLENGPSSAAAHFFESTGVRSRRSSSAKLLLPILGDQYGQRARTRRAAAGVHRRRADPALLRPGLPINPREAHARVPRRRSRS